MFTPRTTKTTSGRRVVQYRNGDGVRLNALVMGGSGSILNLRIPELGGAARNLVAVPRMTARNQTGVWIGRV